MRVKFLEAAAARLLLNQRRERMLVCRDFGFTQIILEPLGTVGKRFGCQLLHQALEAVEIDLAAVHSQRQIQRKQQNRIAERVGRRLRPHPIQNRAEHRGVDRAGRLETPLDAACVPMPATATMLAEVKSYVTRLSGQHSI